MNNLEDLLSAPDVSVLSKEALSVPREFRSTLIRQHVKQERRKFYEVPEQPSSFGHLTERRVPFPDALCEDFAELRVV